MLNVNISKMNSKVFIWNLSFTIILLSIWQIEAQNFTGELFQNYTIDANETKDKNDMNTTLTVTTTIRTASKFTHNTLVLCQCGPGEVMGHTGQCQPWADGTSVPMESPISQHLESQLVDTMELNATINEPVCQHHQIDLNEDQFILRHRGDLVVMKGILRGLRVADYCIHHQERGKTVKVTARGCVSIPVIPRCCHEGNHMINGDCAPTTISSKPFNPPLSTGPYGDEQLAGGPFPWDDFQETVEKLNCAPGHVMQKVELDEHKAYLAVLPQDVLLTWDSEGDQRQYSLPPQYCVDVQVDDDDSYYAYACQIDLEVYCENKTCTNKCCPEGQALAISTRGCVPSDLPFKPPFTSVPSSLETLYSYPSCTAVNIDNFQLLQNGTLLHRSNRYSFDKFCTDTFIKDNTTELGALACILEIQATLWHDIRGVLFPVCMGLSCTFLVLLLLMNALIPKLRKKEGKYQLFHAASLLMAYSVSLLMQFTVPNGYVDTRSCVALAFVMQFAFLSAFFWLNMMCFDVWRLFRNLVKNMSTPVASVATWKYMLYALGGPIIIITITITVQFSAPTDGSIPWLVHPRIGEGRCWFKSDRELLAYFYGPIAGLFLMNFIFLAITFHYIRIIRGDYKSAKDPAGYNIASAETTSKYDFYATYWQRFFLLVLLAGIWMTEILSWKIPPEELWAATDILNNLQGVLVFFVFLYPQNKRTLLREKLSKVFRCSDNDNQNDKEKIIELSNQ